ncbi:MAG: hypothetical protein ACLTTH_12240 [Holdemanella porci]
MVKAYQQMTTQVQKSKKLSGITSGAQVNVIESVKVNGTKVEPSSKSRRYFSAYKGIAINE